MLWHLAAGFLYIQMFCIALLILPLISSRTWDKIFRNGLVQKASKNSSFYFNFFIVLLIGVFVEAVRNSSHQKEAYNDLKSHPHDLRPETESLYLMRMFRAQRNLYIAGFSLFVSFVLRRLVHLISAHAKLEASQEATLRQAESASAAAQQLLDQSTKSKSKEKIECDAESEDSLKKLRKELETEKEAHMRTKQDLETLKKQSVQMNAEYDRVTQECQKLQYRVQILDNGSNSDKKSD